MDQLAQQTLNGLATGAGLVLAALGLNLVFGVLRIVNFAHGSLYVLGGYIAYGAMEVFGVNYWTALLVSVLVVALLSTALDPLIFRHLRGKSETVTIIVTFGIAFVLQEVTRIVWGPQPLTLDSPYAKETLHMGDVYVNMQMLVAFIGSALLTVLLILLMRKSWFGLQVRALAHDPFTAQLMGVRVHRISALTWGLAGGLTAAAGVLVLPTHTLQASTGLSVGIMAFAIVIVGGLGSIKGTVIAGLALGIIQGIVQGYIATGIDDLIAFGALILVLLFRPQGLFGAAK